MKEISTGVLREIVKDQERIGKQTIAAEALLARLDLTPIVDVSELVRLREIELLARKITADPRLLLRGPSDADAVALRRLVSAEPEQRDPTP